MTSSLIITDGTNSIDLLDIPGFLLESWRPIIPGFKSDGTYQNSPLSDGRQLVTKQFDNTIEQLSYKGQDVSQDDLITRIQDLVRLLEKAVQYWATDWQDTPVWIEAKAKCETNTRYGHIMSYRIPELENPYNQPFLQPDESSVMDDLTLILEHTTWTENVPGVGTDVELSAVEAYDGRNLGNVDSSGVRDPTTANEVYIANKRNTANLTDVYRDNGGVFSANLMNIGIPTTLLPAVPAVNDALYLGIDTSLADSGPFASLVFDVGTAGAGYTGAWEYWNGAWVALTVQDNTNQDGAGTGIPFDTAGVNSVHWEQPSDWVTTIVNAVTGYWVRMRVTGTPGALTTPTQQNRDIYSIVWPYVEIQSTEIGGDIPCLSRIQIYNQSGDDKSTNPKLGMQRVIIGARSISRSLSYTAYLNYSDEQNPSGLSITFPLLGASFVNRVQSPTGRVVDIRGFPSSAARIFLDDTITEDYIGTFRVFVRAEQYNGVAGDMTLQFIAGIGSATSATRIYTSDSVSFNETGKIVLLDFGKLTVDRYVGGSRPAGLSLDITTTEPGGGGTTDAYLYDLILLPVDEWAGDFIVNDYDSTFDYISVNNAGGFNQLDVNSITYPKRRIQTNPRSTSTIVSTQYVTISNGSLSLQTNSRQRIWFLVDKEFTIFGSETNPKYEIASSVLVSKNQQYISMRGNR